MRWLLFFCAAACTLTPPRAVVSGPGTTSRAAERVVLVMPTTCVAQEAYLCEPAAYVRNVDGTPRFKVAATFAELIDPLVRLKLELAGFTLADARTLRLETAQRTDQSTVASSGGAMPTASTSTQIDDVPTVLSLSAEERVVAARSIGLQAMLTSTMHVLPARYGMKRFEIVLELRSLAADAVVWTVRCGELFDSVEGTPRLLANCVGDGVLASQAPDALIRKAR